MHSILYLRMCIDYLKLIVYSCYFLLLILSFYLFILLAVEKTRVKLNAEGSNDYINANHIKVVRKADINKYV